MGSDWPFVRIDDLKADHSGSIAIGPFGSRMKSDCYVPQGIPVIRGTNITGGPCFEGEFVFITEEKADSLGSSNVYQYDLVFPHRGAIGEVGIVLEDKRFVLSSSLMKLTCDRSKVNPKYLYYFFKSKTGQHELLKNSSQVGTPGIGQPLTSLKSIVLRLPPKEVQDEIAWLITSLDDKIELNRQINTTLESMAQALFKSWFVDFDPVIDNALAAGNPIPEPLMKRAQARAQKRQELHAAAQATQSANGSTDASPLNPLPAEIQQLFPSSFVFTEEMGWVPEGWSVLPLSQAININPRVSIKKGKVAKYVDMKALPTTGFMIEDVIEKEFSGGAKFENNDVLLARITPCLENGKTGLVDFLECDEAGFGSTEFIVLRQKGPIKMPYIAALSRYPEFRSHCVLNMVGSSGRQRVQNACFDSYFVSIPRDSVLLDKFDELGASYFRKMAVCRDGNRSLSALRDLLLPKLLSGQLQISEVEAQLAEVM